MLETKKEECVTCGTGFIVRVCSNCAVGHDAWNIWFRTAAPPELKDHTGRISVENKRLIDGILDAEFGGQITVRNVAAAVETHVQRQRLGKEAALAAQEAAIAARLLAADRYFAARLQKHADVAASRTIIARIRRFGKALLSRKAE